MSQNRRIDLNDVSYQMLLEDTALLKQVERQARQERAAAMHELMVAPAARFFERLPQDLAATLPRRFAGLCLAATICLAAAAAVAEMHAGTRDLKCEVTKQDAEHPVAEYKNMLLCRTLGLTPS